MFGSLPGVRIRSPWGASLGPVGFPTPAAFGAPDWHPEMAPPPATRSSASEIVVNVRTIYVGTSLVLLTRPHRGG